MVGRHDRPVLLCLVLPIQLSIVALLPVFLTSVVARFNMLNRMRIYIHKLRQEICQDLMEPDRVELGPAQEGALAPVAVEPDILRDTPRDLSAALAMVGGLVLAVVLAGGVDVAEGLAAGLTASLTRSVTIISNVNIYS
jgi:hypothetical protein